jgi:GNAT superfamily N-acetyltransferase
MQHQIREACPEDAETIAQLVGVLGYELSSIHVAARFDAYRGEFSRVFVASNAAGLVGFLSFHAIPLFHEAAMIGRITAMAIDPRHQREGIGSSLVRAAEDFAISVGCSRMEVTSGDRREQDAHVFYAAQGYRSDCRRFLKHVTNTEPERGGNLALFGGSR